MCFHSASGSLFPLSLTLSLHTTLHLFSFCLPPPSWVLSSFGSPSSLFPRQPGLSWRRTVPDPSLVPDMDPRITSLEICLHSKHCKQNKRLACSSITGYLIRDGFSHGDNAHIFDLLEGWACSSAGNSSGGNLSGRFFSLIARVCRSSRRWTESLIARLILAKSENRSSVLCMFL